MAEEVRVVFKKYVQYATICRHGTGHGIGTYGGVHESPIQVQSYNF